MQRYKFKYQKRTPSSSVVSFPPLSFPALFFYNAGHKVESLWLAEDVMGYWFLVLLFPRLEGGPVRTGTCLSPLNTKPLFFLYCSLGSWLLRQRQATNQPPERWRQRSLEWFWHVLMKVTFSQPSQSRLSHRPMLQVVLIQSSQRLFFCCCYWNASIYRFGTTVRVHSIKVLGKICMMCKAKVVIHVSIMCFSST